VKAAPPSVSRWNSQSTAAFGSGPRRIVFGRLPGVGTANSAISPSGVIRPIRLPRISVNQTFPSGPARRVRKFGHHRICRKSCRPADGVSPPRGRVWAERERITVKSSTQRTIGLTLSLPASVGRANAPHTLGSDSRPGRLGASMGFDKAGALE
jgi:hypothetical protein